MNHQFIEKTLETDTGVIHLVPEKDSLFAKQNCLFNQQEKSIIGILNKSGYFTLKDYHIEQNESESGLILWMLKLLSHTFIYNQKSSSFKINLIAFDNEIEHLASIVGALEVTGFATNVNTYVGHKHSSKKDDSS